MGERLEERRALLAALTNFGNPIIRVVEGNYKNRGELYLVHDWAGAVLQFDHAQLTLQNLQRLWGRPVHIETVIDDVPSILSFDGSTPEVRDK